MKKIGYLIIFIIITFLIGSLSGALSNNDKDLYTSLTQPALSPPGWLFGVVWPILYILMGISLYIIYKSEPSNQRNTAIFIYCLQLFVNFLWPIVFFRFQWYWISVGVIILLDLLILISLIKFYNINKTAGYMLIPYLAWILFATYLNIAIAKLNT